MPKFVNQEGEGKTPEKLFCLLHTVTHTPPTPHALTRTTSSLQDADADAARVAARYAVETLGAVRVLRRGAGGNASLASSPPCRSSDVDASGGGGAACGRHALFALRLALECFGYPSALLLGDAARLAPDALEFFAGAAWLPASDATLWAVAGASGLKRAGGGKGGNGGGGAAAAAGDPGLALRTDSLPALEDAGWLVPRAVGKELLAAWRRGRRAGNATAPFNTARGWLRWLRSPAARRGRQCVVPEVPRVWAAGDAEAEAAAAAALDGAQGSSDGSSTGSAGGGGGNATSVGDLLAALDVARVQEEAAAAGAAAATTAANKGTSSSAAAAAAAAGGGWLDADLSWLLEPAYARQMLAVRPPTAPPAAFPPAASILLPPFLFRLAARCAPNAFPTPSSAHPTPSPPRPFPQTAPAPFAARRHCRRGRAAAARAAAARALRGPGRVPGGS